MTYLDDAMLEQIAYIVISEGRAFSFKDLLRFEIDGKVYGMTHGTFRNKIRKLKLAGIIELDYNSGIAFYTLKGHRHGNRVTPNHTGVIISHNDPVYQMFLNLPMDKQSIHDIRLRFTAPNIYETFSVNAHFPKDDRSKDIRLPYWNINNATVQVRIHKTDTVTVIIACSREPFPLDYNGIIRFFTTLASTQGLLVGIMLMVYHEEINQNQSIPDYRKWVITLWHFGRDGFECSKRDFHIAVGKAGHILDRIYTKDFGKQKKPRLERQEYPIKFSIEAVEEKLNIPDSSNTRNLIST